MEKWKLPKGWEWHQLRSLVQVKYGKGLAKSKRVGGDVPVYGANGIVGYHDQSLTQKNTIIIGRKGSAGAVNYSDQPCWPIDTTFYIDEFPNSVEPTFLYLFLRRRDLSRLQQSAAIPGLNRELLYSVEIPIPYPDDPERSLAEQRRIVARLEALLDEVREMRALAQSMQEDIERVMDAVYEETYPGKYDSLPEGWEMLTFPDVCEINPRRPRIERDADAPTSFVPMAAVDEVTGSIVAMETVPYQQVRSGYRYFENGDVIFAKITPSMQNGKAAIASGLIDGFGFGSTEFHIFRPKPGIMPDWIYHYIRRKKFRKEAEKRFRGAAGQQRVPQDFLETHTIPVPYPNDPKRSLAVQKRLVSMFNAVKEEVIEMQQSVEQDLKRIDTLEQSILAAAFRGEI